LVADAWTSRDEGGVHVDTTRKVYCLGQIAMLTKELREGDGLAEGGSVELVGRLEYHDYITTAVGVQGIAAVHVAQLFLLENC
jgi:hypothetical protein